MKRTIPVTLAILLLALPVALAATTISLSQSYTYTDASQDASGNYFITQGDSFTLHVDLTNSDTSSATGVQATLTLPSGLSTTDSLTQNVGTISGGTTGSASWEITGASAGNYANSIQVAVSGTNINSISDTKSIMVKAPASIMGGISCAAQDSQVPKSGFNVVVTASNMGDLDATGINSFLTSTPSATFTALAAISDISGGESGSATYSVSAATTGSYTFTASVSSTNAGTDTATCTVTVANTVANGYVCASASQCTSGVCTSDVCVAAGAVEEGGSPGGGGGGAAAPVSGKVSKSWNSITPGEEAEMTVNRTDNGFTRIAFMLRYGVSAVTMDIEALSGRPSGVAAPSNLVFQYINVTTVLPESSIQSGKISFKVNKTWVLVNNINVSAIHLERWTGSWQPLVTRQTSQDGVYYYYESDTPGFSYFVITGPASGVAQTPGQLCNNDGDCDIGEDNSNCPRDCVPGQVAQCANGQVQCLGMTLQECVNQEWSDKEECGIGCQDGACLTEGLPVGQLDYGILIIAILAIFGVAAVFIYKRGKKHSPEPRLAPKANIPTMSP